jgi:hypothetical protein
LQTGKYEKTSHSQRNQQKKREELIAKFRGLSVSEQNAAWI